MALSASLKKYYASAPAGVFVFQTLELSHPQFTTTHFITNNPEKVTATDEGGTARAYISLPFGIRMPTKNASGRQELQIEIDNVDQQILMELERAAADFDTPISVTFREYTSDSLAAPASNPITLVATDIEATEASVVMTATRADVLNRVFPSLFYTLDRFPGLDR